MPSVLITGANRGLGLELARQYLLDGWSVIATARVADEASELRALAAAPSQSAPPPSASGAAAGRLQVHALDVADFAAIDVLARELAGEPIDVLINNAGLFGPKARAENDPRQEFGHMDYAMWARLFEVNTMAPLRMAEAFIEHLAAGTQRKLVTITSGIGSIANADGRTIAYRTSKAAANMLMHNLAFDLRPRGIVTAALCPGWVRTRMGGAGASLQPQESVAGMRRVIAALTPENSGRFWLYDGASLPW